MSINYEKISDEWLEYISKLELDERKQKFQQYLEASGVYDLDSSTTFYKSELNNFLTEGITTLLHNKAQDAKKSGKGLAHYRHTSFMLSKPDAMNIVHQYIHAKMLAHPLMVEQGTTAIPDNFKWEFLFNVPEYVFHKPLLSESDIPQLPEPRKIPKEEELNYSPDHFPDDSAGYSPDPFDVDDQQQVIENLKDKFVTNLTTETNRLKFDAIEQFQSKIAKFKKKHQESDRIRKDSISTLHDDLFATLLEAEAEHEEMVADYKQQIGRLTKAKHERKESSVELPDLFGDDGSVSFHSTLLHESVSSTEEDTNDTKDNVNADANVDTKRRSSTVAQDGGAKPTDKTLNILVNKLQIEN
eukprot:821127_1